MLLILSFLVLQGCDQRHGITNVYRGTRGVEIDFVNNAPPTEIIENTEAPVMIEVWNRGAYTIPSGDTVVNLRYDPIYFELDHSDTNFYLARNPDGVFNVLEGKSSSWPEGEKIILPFTKLISKDIPGTRESPITNLELVACYNYKTFFSEMICLDTDVYEVDTDPICRNRGTYTHSNQGAPIAVNKIEVDMLPMGFVETDPSQPLEIPVYTEDGERMDPSGPAHSPGYDDEGNLGELNRDVTTERLILVEPVIRIYARNVGRGDVFTTTENVDTVNLCAFRDHSFEFREHNKIKLTKANLDGLPMDCNKELLNLANPSDFITCRLNPEQTGYLRQNIQVPLDVEFEYHYRESKTQQVRIRRST